MRSALLLSIRLHWQWLIKAFSKDGRKIAPLTPYRLIVLLLFFPLYLLFQAWNWLCLFADEIFFPGYRQIEIQEPLFIAGIPRSGTTFIHRTLAGDPEHFTTFTTWQALFAPSICQRRLIKLLSRIDNTCGRPLHRILGHITCRLTGDMEHIHAVGLHAPEEDYLTLLPAAGCFIMITAFPAGDSVWSLGRFDEMPCRRRQILLDFYKACLQKHMHEAAPGTRLLSKNAAFASWLSDLHTVFPDARYLLCIRHPQSALSSQLSSLRPGLNFFGTAAAAGAVSVAMQGILAEAYRKVLDGTGNIPVNHFSIIDQGQLRNNTRTLLHDSLHQLHIPISNRLRNCIEEAARASGTRACSHRHSLEQPEAKEYGSSVRDIYEKIKHRQLLECQKP